MIQKRIAPQIQDDESAEIDLLVLVQALLRHFWIIILAALFLGIVAYLGTRLLVTPTYQSNFTAYINNSDKNYNSDTVTSSDISASRYLTATYASIIASQPVVESAMKKAQLDYVYSDLKPAVSVEALNSTEIIQVKVVTADPQVSYLLAAALEEVAPERVEAIVNGTSMVIVTPASYSSGIYSPNYIKNAMLGALLGGMLSAAFLVLLELLDNRIKDSEELEKNYGFAVIGVIHDLKASEKTGYRYYSYHKKEEK